MPRENKDFNIKITNEYLSGKSTEELAIKYKKGHTNIGRIVRETKAKYPELLINK